MLKVWVRSATAGLQAKAGEIKSDQESPAIYLNIEIGVVKIVDTHG